MKLKEKIKSKYLNWVKKTTNTLPLEVEKHEYSFYIKYLREGMTVFDVGANHGELCLLFSKFIGSEGKLHAFEASAATFNKLKQICELTQRKQIFLNHQAVCDREGVVKIHIYEDEFSGWNSLADRPLKEYGIDVKNPVIEEVKAITIDKYCEINSIKNIDLLKIDVEGAEYQVLLGAKNMLEKHQINCCVFEFGATTFDMGNDPKEILNFLERLGYNIRNIVREDPVFPGYLSAKQSVFSIHIATPKK
jgi:FkbM family methyltransferase